MKLPFRELLKSILQLGPGDFLGRLCSAGTAILLGHRYGVVILGAYALAQSLNQYLQPLIDFGLRHVGARLIALYPQAASVIIARVQRRRLGMALAVLPVIFLYSACAKLPPDMRIFLFVFSAMGALYALSLDWVAWGRGKLPLVGLARTAVPLSILLFLCFSRSRGDGILWWAVAGNGFGFLMQAAIFWIWWKRQPSPAIASGTLDTIREALAWRRTSIMGLAWLCNLAFNTIDLLMLGAMSNPEQVGLYGAAYRVLNQVLATYYLLTYVLYPRFARHTLEDRTRMLRPQILFSLATVGIVFAVVISLSRATVLTVLFGRQFLASSPLLLLLAWSIPLDFVTSYLSNAYIAWGMEKKILLCTGIGAASNVVLNLALIPIYGAWGAAVNTLASYVIFLAALGIAGKTARQLSPGPQLDLDAVVCP